VKQARSIGLAKHNSVNVDAFSRDLDNLLLPDVLQIGVCNQLRCAAGLQ